MRIHATDRIQGVWLVVPANERLRHVVWGDCDTGEYQTLLCNADGLPVKDAAGQPIRHVHKVSAPAKLEFIPRTMIDAAKIQKLREMNTPLIGTQHGRLLRENTAPQSSGRGTRIIPMEMQRCEARGCQRPAEWSTADEQELPPALDAIDRRYQKAKTVKRHLWCSWHYQWPQFTSLRGVTREVETPARPD